MELILDPQGAGAYLSMGAMSVTEELETYEISDYLWLDYLAPATFRGLQILELSHFLQGHEVNFTNIKNLAEQLLAAQRIRPECPYNFEIEIAYHILIRQPYVEEF